MTHQRFELCLDLRVRIRDQNLNVLRQTYMRCLRTLTLKEVERKIINMENEQGRLLNEEYDPFVQPSSLHDLGYTNNSSVDFVIARNE